MVEPPTLTGLHAACFLVQILEAIFQLFSTMSDNASGAELTTPLITTNSYQTADNSNVAHTAVAMLPAGQHEDCVDKPDCDTSDVHKASAHHEHSGSSTGQWWTSQDKSKASWPLTASILLGEMLGLGALALPGDLIRLGWIPGLTLLVIFCVLAMYSGVLYSRLMAAKPHVTMLDQLGAEALGKRLGRQLVFWTVYTTILIIPIIFHLTAAEALQKALYMHDISWAWCVLIVAVLILPLAQFRKMAEVGWVSLIGTAAILLAIMIAGLKAAVLDPKPQQSPHHDLVRLTPVMPALVGAMDIVFCFSGESPA